jgi:hypothetical protein
VSATSHTRTVIGNRQKGGRMIKDSYIFDKNEIIYGKLKKNKVLILLIIFGFISIILFLFLRLNEILNNTAFSKNLTYSFDFLIGLFLGLIVFFFSLIYNSNNLIFTLKNIIISNNRYLIFKDYIKIPIEIIYKIQVERKIIITKGVYWEYFCLIIKSFEPIKFNTEQQVIKKINFISEKEIKRILNIFHNYKYFNVNIESIIEFSEIINLRNEDLNNYIDKIKHSKIISLLNINITLLMVIYIIVIFSLCRLF